MIFSAKTRRLGSIAAGGMRFATLNATAYPSSCACGDRAADAFVRKDAPTAWVGLRLLPPRPGHAHAKPRAMAGNVVALVERGRGPRVALPRGLA